MTFLSFTHLSDVELIEKCKDIDDALIKELCIRLSKNIYFPIPNRLKLTKQIFEDIFYKATDELLNTEEAINTSINTINNDIIITFDIDDTQGRIHTGSVIKIFTDNSVLIDLCEGFEGCGLEETIEFDLTEKINKNK